MTFRSTACHNTLTVKGLEQNNISPPEKMLFKMIDRSQAKGEIVDESTFTGVHWGYGEGHTRSVHPLPKEIKLEDTLAQKGPKQVHFTSTPPSGQWKKLRRTSGKF